MASITSLPNELIAFVLGNLKSQRDIASLCRTNRKLYQAVTSTLYKNAVDRRDFWPLAYAAFSGTASTMRMVLAAGADPNFTFDNVNYPGECFGLLAPERDCLCDTQHRHGLSRWSPDSVPFYSDLTHDDGDDSDYYGDQPDAWHGWSGMSSQDAPLMVIVDHPDLDDDYGDDDDGGDNDDGGDDNGDLSDTSDADSSTLGYSERLRDQPVVLRSPYGEGVSRSFRALHIAAGRGNNEVVEVLLASGACINSGSKDLCPCRRAAGLLNSMESPETEECLPSWTPLHTAICHNRPETAMLLLSRGADCMMESVSEQNEVEQYDSTALHHAAALGQAGLVKYLIENHHHTDIDVRDRRTLTPFYYAYANGRWDSTIPLLLQMGANINVEIKFYQPYCTITPLGEAIRLGNFDSAQKLIDLGANPSHGFVSTGTGHRKGLSPLHLACMPSAKPPDASCFLEDGDKALERRKFMETLIAKGSDIHSTNCYGDTPLIMAAQNRVLPALRALIAAGADVNARNSLGRTVAMQAVLGPPIPLPGSGADDYERNTETVRVLSDILSALFRAGARIQDVDPQGNTVLHLLLDMKLSWILLQGVLRFLLNYPDADLMTSVRNHDGNLPFHVAFYSATGNGLEACQMILRRGAIQRALTPDDLHAMFKFAKTNAVTRPLDLLLDLDLDRVLVSNPGLFTECVTDGSWNAVSAIAHRGFPPLDSSTCTRLLRRALNACKWDIAYQLIERGADVNALSEDGTETPLILVLDQLGNVPSDRLTKLVRILIARGADIHYSPCGGSWSRPLTTAIKDNSVRLVRVMLQAQPLRGNPRAAEGFYLHSALRWGKNTYDGTTHRPSRRIVYSLIHSGADLTELNEDGDYPLSVLLQGLCSVARQTYSDIHFQPFWYGNLLRDLYVPGVCITRPNGAGRSALDYFEELLKTKAGMRHLAPRVEVVEGPSGAKEFKFRQDMKLRRMSDPVFVSCESTPAVIQGFYRGN